MWEEGWVHFISTECPPVPARVLPGSPWRKSAGMERRRAIIFVEDRPLVEFAAANDFEKTKLMASIIRRDRKQIKALEAVPAGYEGLKIEYYNQIVRGPRAARNLAVVCKVDDYDTMVRHALMRSQGIEARAKTKKRRLDYDGEIGGNPWALSSLRARVTRDLKGRKFVSEGKRTFRKRGRMTTYRQIQRRVRLKNGVSIKTCWIAHVKE